MRVDVHSIVGEFGITPEDGAKLFEVIHPELAAGRPVELDFRGVNVFASPFFNGSVGKLLADIDPQRLEADLKCLNLTPVGERVLQRVIKNSEEYYRDPGARRALDSILSDEAD